MCEIWCFNVTHLNAVLAEKRLCCVKYSTVISKMWLYFILWDNFTKNNFNTLTFQTAIAWMWLLYYCFLLFLGRCIRGLNWGMLHSNMWRHSGYVNSHVFLPLCICTTPEEGPLSFYTWPWSEGCVAAACFSECLNVIFFLLDPLCSCHWNNLIEKHEVEWQRVARNKTVHAAALLKKKKMSLLVLSHLVSEQVHSELQGCSFWTYFTNCFLRQQHLTNKWNLFGQVQATIGTKPDLLW